MNLVVNPVPSLRPGDVSGAGPAKVAVEKKADGKDPASQGGPASAAVKVELMTMKEAVGLAVLNKLYGTNGKMVGAAGRTEQGSTDDLYNRLLDFVRGVFEKQGIEFKQISQDEAQALIADDGYWGAPQTSQRILDFVKGVSGGDQALFEKIKNAVIEGFSQARQVFGGWLPDVSNRTYDLVMKGLDEMFAPNTDEGQPVAAAPSEGNQGNNTPPVASSA